MQNFQLMRLNYLLLFLFSSMVSYSQIEDLEQVNFLLENNKRLGLLYQDFPNAKKIFRESKKVKIEGIMLE